MGKELLENIMVSSGKFNKEKEYWMNKLSGELNASYFPTDYIVNINDYKDSMENIGFKLSENTFINMNKVTNKSKYGIFMVLVTGVTYLLYKYTSNEDICVGTPVFKTDTSKELLNNFLILRNKINKNMTFRELLAEVKTTVMEANDNMNYPFNKIMEELNIPFSKGKSSLFNTLLCLEDIQDIDCTQNIYSDIFFYFRIVNNSMEFDIKYNSALFDKETIIILGNSVINYLEEVFEDYNKKISDIQIISKEDREKICSIFNNTFKDYPKDKTITELFEEQVNKKNDSVAVIFKDEKITYRELNERSNQFARMLISRGVESGDVIAYLTNRSIEMLIVTIGILKANAVCLPLDVKYPENRLKMILTDSNAKIMIYTNETKEISCFWDKIIEFNLNDIEQYGKENLKLFKDPASIAYIIYTSGSTGNPKGVPLCHYGIINHIFNKILEAEIMENDILGHNLSMNFVASIWNIFAPLFIGGKLVIYDEELMVDPYNLLKQAELDGVNILEIVPSSLSIYLELLDEGKDKIIFSNLKTLILTGEKIKYSLINKFYKEYKLNLINAYGQSECSDDTFHYKIPYKEELKVIPIGKPCKNIRAYILDKNMNLQPIGLVGELYIAGDGVAKGYLNRAELTEEKFIPNPYEENSIMYNTGDLARWLIDGNVEYIGRVDHQVKIRGYRIELDEVEQAFLKCDYIKQAVVISRSNNEDINTLFAYVTVKEDVDVSEIRNILLKELPDYMIPSYIIKIKEIPLTPNGKTDRKSLEKMEFDSYVKSSKFELKNKTEEKLAEMWKSVLNINEIGLDDDFFQYGGESLKGTILISRIDKEFNVKLSLRELFVNTTIRKLEKIINENNKFNKLQMVKVKANDFYDVSPFQKSVYIESQLNEPNINYNVNAAFIVEGNLNIDKFKNAVNSLIDRYEIFRTSFHFIDGNPVQKVNSNSKANIIYEEADENQLEAIINEFIQPFDINTYPLFKVGIVKLKQDKHLIIWDLHHLIIDGFSINILTKECISLYNGKSLEKLKYQYKDYCSWYNNLIKEGMIINQERYWLEKYKDSQEIPLLNLNTDYPRSAIKNSEGDKVVLKLDKQLVEQLNNVALETRTTMFIVLMAAYNVLLYRYTGQEDIIVGTPVSGRSYKEIENMIGSFINIISLRSYPKGEKSFRKLLEEIKEDCLSSLDNQDYQLEKLIEKLNLKRDQNGNSLFRTMFILQNTNNSDLKWDGFKVSEFKYKKISAKYDLLAELEYENDGSMMLNIEYKKELFKVETINRLGKSFIDILKQVTQNNNINLSQINILSKEDQKLIELDFNDTKLEYDNTKVYTELFEKQVNLSKDNIAVICKDESLTYKELNIRANRIAKILRKKGVGRGAVVGLMINRSIEMIIDLIAIIKAGGTYLPIDPEYPITRIEYMLKDSNTKVLLTKRNLVNDINFNGEIIDIDEEIIEDFNSDNLELVNTSDDLIYIIYTSGSTGNPKGVMITHKNITNFITAIVNKINFNKESIILSVTTMCFDIFFLESLLPLTQGLKVIIATEEQQKDPKELSKIITDNNVSMIQMTPSRMQLIMSREEYSKSLKALDTIMIGGEAFPLDLLERIRKVTDATIYNMYGPTETTIWSLIKDVTGVKNITIGNPIGNTQVYIVDSYNNIQPLGVAGELCISGDGVTRGYYNKPELTSEKFVENVFISDVKMYKTGDLAKILPNGDVEFLGRIDNQVKIRGYRVELEEIENQLLKHEFIKEAVVIVNHDKNMNKYLYSYIVAEKNLSNSEIRTYLSGKLPEYMIPSYTINLDKLPKTQNDKIDKKALLKYEVKQVIEEKKKEPENEVQSTIAKIWCKILGKEKVGIDDDFFDIGGTSLLLVNMFNQIDEIYPNKVRVVDLLSNPTILALSKFIYKDEKSVKYKDIELKTLQLPKEYFSNEFNNGNNSMFKYELDDELYSKLKHISNNEDIETNTILLLVYSYLLSKISLKNIINIQTKLTNDEFFYSVDIDLKDASDFYKKAQNINEILINRTKENLYVIENISKIKNHKNDYEIIPMFSKREYIHVNQKILEIYDIVITTEEKNESLNLVCEFNNKRLTNEKIKMVLINYINLIKLIVNQYNN